MSDFEKWFVDQDFYTNMRFIYGENLFHKDLGAYRILPVQMTFKAWNQQQATIDELQSQLNSMEACYIEKKKQVDEALTEIGHYWKTGATDCIESAEEALRGDND